MTDKEISRFYIFNSDTIGDAALAGLEWVLEQGGTIITNLKQTFRNSFGLETDRKYEEFEKALKKREVYLCTLQGSSPNLRGKRLVLLYLDERELERVENIIEYSKTDGNIEEILLVVWNSSWIKNWVSRYNAKIIGEAPDSWHYENANEEISLPQDIVRILKLFASRADLNNGTLPWQEIEQLKSDLMINWDFWRDISVENIRAQCKKLNMSLSSARTIIEQIEKRKAGKCLVPDRSYIGSTFKHDKKA